MKRSLSKAVYVLLPLLVFYITHDILRLMLMFVIQMAADVSVTARDFMVCCDSAISAAVNALDMAGGAAALLFLMRRDANEISIHDYVNQNGMSFYRADRGHAPWVSWCLIMVQGISAAIGINVLMSITGFNELSASTSQAAAEATDVPFVIGILLYVIVSPVVEELLFRIIIFGRMKRTFPYAVAVIVSSLFFGLYHGNLIQGIYGMIMGIIMCLACDYLHSVLAPLAIHMAANLVIYVSGAAGFYENLCNVTACVLFLAATAITVVIEIVFYCESRKKYGIPYGIAPVGIFFTE